MNELVLPSTDGLPKSCLVLKKAECRSIHAKTALIEFQQLFANAALLLRNKSIVKIACWEMK